MPLTTKAGKRSRTPSTVRGVLDMIDRFLSSPEVSYPERRDLWNILSAIRGPDVGIGKSLTVQVRERAFPRTAAAANGFSYGAQMRPWPDDQTLTLDDLFQLDAIAPEATSKPKEVVRSSHFSAHIFGAFHSLGMMREGEE